MDSKSRKREPDLRWTDEFDKKARSEGWSLFSTGVGRCEIQKLDDTHDFASDWDAVGFAYDKALGHEPHARAAFVLSLGSLKKED